MSEQEVNTDEVSELKTPEDAGKELTFENAEPDVGEAATESSTEKELETNKDEAEKPSKDVSLEESDKPKETDAPENMDVDLPESENLETVEIIQAGPNEAEENSSEEPESPNEEGFLSSPANMDTNDPETDDNLLADEQLNGNSPEVWPEKIPGVQEFVQEHPSKTVDGDMDSSPPGWTKGLTQDDIDQMHKLGAMSNAQLISEIKRLYDHAYKVGIEEAKEMTRGKILQIFTHSKKK